MTPRIPGCSYRLQLNKSFNFRDATALVDYLDALGVTDVYASPFLVARARQHARLRRHRPCAPEPRDRHGRRPGRAGGGAEAAGHGADHGRRPQPHVHRQLGQPLVERRARERAQLALRRVLRHRLAPAEDRAAREGAAARARRAVRPRAREPGAHGRLRGRRVLRRATGRVALSRSGRARILPLLEPIVADLRRSHPRDHPDVLEIESIVTATTHLPTRWDTEPEQVRERMREKEIVKRRLDALVSGSAAVRDALERSLARDQRREGQPAQLRPAGGAARPTRPTA